MPAKPHWRKSIVSLLWRNHLRIGLCADRLLLAEYRRGLKPSKSQQQIVPVQASANGPEWRAAVDALAEVFANAKRPEASIVLADQFVRYVLLPPNQALKSDEQWLALARPRFGSIYRSGAPAWGVKGSRNPPPGPRPAIRPARAP